MILSNIYICMYTKRLSRFSIILERLLGMASSWGLAKMPSSNVGPQSEQIRKSSRTSRRYLKITGQGSVGTIRNDHVFFLGKIK